MRHQNIIQLGVLVALLAPTMASAQDCDEGEKVRLGGEIRNLAQRNAWPGVENSYRKLVATGCRLSYEDHLLGSQAAAKLGKTFEVYSRLSDARSFDQRSEIIEEMESIDQHYGRVEIRGDARFRAELLRESMPFNPAQRKSIEYAMEVVENTGSFKGMLPRGEYLIGARVFVVEPGDSWQLLEVEKTKGRGEDQPFFRYVNLVAGVGPSLMYSAEPGNSDVSSGLADGSGTFAPASHTGTGGSAEIGVELGLTYQEPTIGVAVTATYDGTFGAHKAHTVNGWFAGVVRPEEWRFAFGPTYGLSFAQGQGVASWFDRNQTEAPEDIEYRGVVRAAGVRASAGYGLMDLDKYRGMLNLDLAWRNDSARNYIGFGLRFGIVPTVPRFKG
jgi:hypothetical protein